MKRINAWLFLLFLFFFFTTEAQKKATKKPATQKTQVTKPVVEQKLDVKEDEKKVRSMVAFFEYMLNTLGSSSTPIRDKEVLITESYSKIFRDSKVQIEDDLDEDRKVITNKDVVAYLKDVNFFFQDVRFEFTIEEIKVSSLADGHYFYKVTITRNLKGITSDQKAVNNTQQRYLEINYNPKDQDLKIVSIYTNEFDEKRALMSWWNDLSYEWQSIFTRKLNLSDSVSLGDVKRITAIDELDISNNQYIQTLEPLSQLLSLNHLDVSGTKISDLTPIRNLTELESLTVSDTPVKDLLPLKYSSRLKKLNINHTDVIDISVVDKMTALQSLEMRETQVIDFASIGYLTELEKLDLSTTAIVNLAMLEDLTQLTELNISNTNVEDLNPLKGLKKMRLLELDSTRIQAIGALGSLESLNVLHANYTSISDLTPLQNLEHLEKIYCDQTKIQREAADAFMAANPAVLVIFDSKDLKVWWDLLSSEWRDVFSKTAKISASPSKEELALLPLLDSINISGSGRIDNLEPLVKLQKLRTVIAGKTNITDLSPLRAHSEIRYLDISETNVTDLSVLVHFKMLTVLKADNTKIKNSESLGIPSLKKFYADDTGITDDMAREFLRKNPNCLLVYKTDLLNIWWNSLTDNWKKVFSHQLVPGAQATRESLHVLVEQRALHFKDASVSDLSALSEFVRLEELHFSGTAITIISPINNIKGLKSLRATNSPIQNIESLSELSELEDLDISNTAVDDVYALWKLKKLKRLNCAGTQIKRLDAMEKLEYLEFLDCSNTNVSKLSPLDYLPLKTLTCYNTKVSSRAIENFKASHPDCEVIFYR